MDENLNKETQQPSRYAALIDRDAMPIDFEEDDAMEFVYYPKSIVPGLGHVNLYLHIDKPRFWYELDGPARMIENGKLISVIEAEALRRGYYALGVKVDLPPGKEEDINDTSRVKIVSYLSLDGQADNLVGSFVNYTETLEGVVAPIESARVYSWKKPEGDRRDRMRLYIKNDPRVLSELKFRFESQTMGGEVN